MVSSGSHEHIQHGADTCGAADISDIAKYPRVPGIVALRFAVHCACARTIASSGPGRRPPAGGNNPGGKFIVARSMVASIGARNDCENFE